MKTKRTSLMGLALAFVSLSVVGVAQVEPPTSAPDSLTVSVPPGEETAFRVVARTVSTALLCEEGRRYLDEQRDICDEEYWGCLSGEDPDGDFELDDHCDSSYRLCLRWAREEAEDLCCPDAR